MDGSLGPGIILKHFQIRISFVGGVREESSRGLLFQFYFLSVRNPLFVSCAQRDTHGIREQTVARVFIRDPCGELDHPKPPQNHPCFSFFALAARLVPRQDSTQEENAWRRVAVYWSDTLRMFVESR